MKPGKKYAAVVWTALPIVAAGLLSAGIWRIAGKGKTTEQQETGKVIQYVSTSVGSGEVYDIYQAQGCIISGRPDVYLEEVKVEASGDSGMEILKEIGETVKEGEAFCRVNGEEKSAGYPAKVVSVEREQTGNKSLVRFGLLNYHKLYAVCYVDSDTVSALDSIVNIEIQAGWRKYHGEIMDIGYEMEDGKLPIFLSLPPEARLLPGCELSVVFTMNLREYGLFLSADAVYEKDDRWYVNIKQNDTDQEFIPKEVKPGEYFRIRCGREVSEFVEILEGLVSGEEVYWEQPWQDPWDNFRDIRL